MSGITMVTALEIFTNPNDLEIFIWQTNDGGNFAFSIARGPGHNYKSLLTSRPFAGTLEGAVEGIRLILEAIRQIVSKQLQDNASMISQFLNPEGWEIDPSNVLTGEFIVRIVQELRQHQKADTSKMFAAAAGAG